MTQSDPTCICPVHGRPTKRATCLKCNAAYMRAYLRRRRAEMPARSMWDRAQKRARRKHVPFALGRASIEIPEVCPALGIPLVSGTKRSDNTPSLDRVVPSLGYVSKNVRVISDRANRLKGRRSLAQLRALAHRGSEAMRRDYALISAYVDREALLQEVWQKANQSGRAGEEWKKIAIALDRLFSRNVYWLVDEQVPS